MEFDRVGRARVAPEKLASDAEEGLAIFEIVPAAAPAGTSNTTETLRVPRVIGPGRIERRYVAALAGLETDLARSRSALEIAGIVERGSSALLDRLEADLVRAHERASELERIQKRLIFTLGGLQRENELMRSARSELGVRNAGALAAGRAFERRASAPRTGKSWLARLFGRRG